VDARERVLPDFLAHLSRAVDKDDPVILICAPAIAPVR
jgi:hypothetical protein